MTITAEPGGLQAEALARRFYEGSREAGSAWLEAIRKAGLAWFAEHGFPTVRHEEWRSTNLAPIAALELRPPKSGGAPNAGPLPFAKLDAFRLIFIDGIYVPALSNPPAEGFAAGSLRERIAVGDSAVERHLARLVGPDTGAFAALNAAFFRDGAFIRVPDGVQASKPVHLLFLNSAAAAGAAVFPRNLILVGRGASISIVESYASLSDAPALTDTVTELALEDGASAEHIKIQEESEQAFHIGTLHAALAAGSRWASHSISTGARLSRHELRARLGGEGADCLLNGLYLGRGGQLIDNHTIVDHAVPKCSSHEFYNGILGGASRGVFKGKIIVRQDAQKTDARQTNRNLLLSEDAVADTKPELEIFADDVKCSHGATIGRLDEDQLFYLRARGIGLDAARRILIKAFAGETVARISLEAVRNELEDKLEARLINNG